MKSIVRGAGPYPQIGTRSKRQGIPSPDRPRVIAKGLIHPADGGLPIWPCDTSGAPHHDRQKFDHGINVPTVDFHIYQDGSFAMWSHRGLKGDPAVAAHTLENATGLNWRGQSIEQVQGVQDKHCGNPWMTDVASQSPQVTPT